MVNLRLHMVKLHLHMDRHQLRHMPKLHLHMDKRLRTAKLRRRTPPMTLPTARTAPRRRPTRPPCRAFLPSLRCPPPSPARRSATEHSRRCRPHCHFRRPRGRPQRVWRPPRRNCRSSSTTSRRSTRSRLPRRARRSRRCRPSRRICARRRSKIRYFFLFF